MKKLKFDPLNIVICGIGGQGNVLASEVVGSAMTDRGYRVAIGETYGASQRGGSVMSHVRVSEDQELSVLIPSGEAHIIIGFEPLETLRMTRKYAGPNTTIVYDPRPVYPLGVLQGIQQYPDQEALMAEIAELSGMRKAEVEDVKRRISPWKWAIPAPPTSRCWAPLPSCLTRP